MGERVKKQGRAFPGLSNLLDVTPLPPPYTPRGGEFE